MMNELEQQYFDEFKPFFEAMAKLMASNHESKGESWKRSSIAYLLDRASVQFEDMQDDPEREDYMANIGNYAGMLWWHEKIAQEGIGWPT